ncbi:MAG: TetR/AcrR family transcriptional regulator [Saccharospirillaceae bacterium]|nr:TetR/AcrR family transcriptional regulator [Pseudomonadales bacterium]NRB77921.1 TetR/AcrR family transcriptional regulator [Saccharospirillaceae bacterium]
MTNKQMSSKDRLISSGTLLFSEKGYAAVSVREICKHAETSMSMIHHYFKNKEGLLETIVDQFTAKTFALPMQLISKPSDSKQDFKFRIEMIFEATLDVCILERDVLLVIIREQCSNLLVVDFQKGFIKFIEQAQQKGFVRKELDASMISGFMMDRIVNQVQFAPQIKQDFKTDLLGDPIYKKRWMLANLDLLLNGMVS